MGTEHNMAQPNVNQENRTQHGTTKREPREQNAKWHKPNVNQNNRTQHGTTKWDQ